MNRCRVYHGIWRLFLRILFRVFFIRWRIEHAERLRGLPGGFLLASNHISNLDPVLLNLLPVPVHFMAKKSLLRVPVLGWCMERAGHFGINRGVPDSASIRHALKLLAGGSAVGMFPEGTRSRDGRLQPGKPGAGLLACRAPVPVVPVAILGSEAILPRGKLVPRVADVRIIVGEALDLSDLRRKPPADREEERARYQEAVDRIMTAIARLQEEVSGTCPAPTPVDPSAGEESPR